MAVSRPNGLDSPVVALERVTIQGFLSRTQVGSADPWFVTDEDRVVHVAKKLVPYGDSGGLQEPQFANEFIGCRLGRMLGLDVPTVRLGEDGTDFWILSQYRENVIHFREKRTKVARPLDLARVLVLDILLQNPDRTDRNLLLQPNGKKWDLVPIDHAEAFVLKQGNAGLEDWMGDYQVARREARHHLRSVLDQLADHTDVELRTCCDGVEELIGYEGRKEAEEVLVQRKLEIASLVPEGFR